MARSMNSTSSPHPIRQNHNNSSAGNLNLIVFGIGMFSFCLDPCFLYLSRDCGSTSICMDFKLGAFLAIVRTLSDASFLYGKFLMANKSVTPDVKEWIYIIRDHLNSTSLTVLAATVPVPQIYVWSKIIRAADTTIRLDKVVPLYLILAPQCSLRAIVMFDVSKFTFRTSGILKTNAWTGAMLNLMYFMVMSHMWGALYYEMYICKLVECKNVALKTEANARKLDWDQVVAVCALQENFEIGMFSDAFATKIAVRSFVQKYVFCLSWGLKSLSSFGQIFSASSDPVDTIFSFLTVVFGLILFGDLLARMQSGLQSTEAREGRHRTKQRMAEEWMAYHQLPHDLKRQVKQAIQTEWSATRGINDEVIMDSLPWDVKCEVRRHLYLDVVHNLPPFADMDVHLVSVICGHLRTFSGNEGTFIAFEGEPVRQMIFIYSGELEISYANRSGQSVTVGPGEFYGQELLEWCSFPTRSTKNLPSSTRTVKCITDVDAFSLAADDVKLLAIQFHRDGKFRRAFQRYAA